MKVHIHRRTLHGSTVTHTDVVDLFEITFDAIAGGLSKENAQASDLAPTFLRVFGTTFTPDTLAGQRTHAFIREYVSNVLQNVEAALCETEEEKQVEATVARLVSVMGTFDSALFEDRDFTSVSISVH